MYHLIEKLSKRSDHSQWVYVFRTVCPSYINYSILNGEK